VAELLLANLLETAITVLLTHHTLRPMTHAPETGAINRLFIFLLLVSGTCVMQIRHRIRVVPDSGADYNLQEHCSIQAKK